MARPRLEIKQNKILAIRLNPLFKKEYSLFCKRNKFVMAKRVRQFMIDDLKENYNGKN